MLLGETVLSMLASSIFAQSPLKVENPAPFISGLLQAKVFVVTPFFFGLFVLFHKHYTAV